MQSGGFRQSGYDVDAARCRRAADRQKVPDAPEVVAVGAVDLLVDRRRGSGRERQIASRAGERAAGDPPDAVRMAFFLCTWKALAPLVALASLRVEK